MEFNLLTFIFELINFLVLIWLLHKLLYRPVIKVLSQRRQFIADRLEAARQKEAELNALQAEYQDLVKNIEERRQREMVQLNADLEQEKARLHKELQAELDAEKQRHQALLEQERQAMHSDILSEAVQTALSYTLRLLDTVQDPHLHEKMVELALETLGLLSQTRHEETLQEIQERGSIDLETAFASSDPLTSRVLQRLQDEFGSEIAINLKHKPQLKAGLRIYLGSRLIDASLLGQVEVFETNLNQHVQA